MGSGWGRDTGIGVFEHLAKPVFFVIFYKSDKTPQNIYLTYLVVTGTGPEGVHFGVPLYYQRPLTCFSFDHFGPVLSILVTSEKVIKKWSPPV